MSDLSSRVDFAFQHAPTLHSALVSDAFVKIVQGPVESGKSVWLLADMYKQMLTMPRALDGYRRSRFLIMRTTEGELKRGIMRSYADWFPEHVYGSPEGSMPAVHKMAFLDVRAEVEFFAFEEASETALKKLRSTEYTSILVNEGQFVSLELFLAWRQRAGRYPRRLDCPAYDRKKRVSMDMNAPRVNDHWVSLMRGEVPMPADW